MQTVARYRPSPALPPIHHSPPARAAARPAVRATPAAMPVPGDIATVRAARRLNRAAGMIATSVLTDSAMEHYRGEFHNRAMWTPIVTAALSLAVSVHGHTDRRTGAHRGRDLVYAAAGLTGLIGTGFHLYNITKKPGGLCWQNLFYAAPIGAPAALSLSGLMGFLSERVRANRPGSSPIVCGFSAGRAVAALTSASLLGTVSEAGLLHFRGAYHNPFMVLPVSLPLVAAALLANAATGKSRVRRRLTRWWLRATALMGFGGVAFHAYGVSRSMGGWRNWRQNAFNGPPLPAPPSFSGLALAGLAALGLLEDHPDD
ncbi:MAG TPA: hypothetical protein VMB71_04345 [Acetobacteraceae bacterium]|nr:hypothetical protein [Acetobacteraceae bacterium]